MDLPAEGGQGGLGDAHMEEIPVPVEPINVDEEQEGNMEEEMVAVIEQPESEMTPSPTTPQSEEPPVVGQPSTCTRTDFGYSIEEITRPAGWTSDATVAATHHLDFR